MAFKKPRKQLFLASGTAVKSTCPRHDLRRSYLISFESLFYFKTLALLEKWKEKWVSFLGSEFTDSSP